MAINTTFSIPVASAVVATDSSAARPHPTLTSPPDYPDSAHVPQGCYISTVTYLAKFAAAFPNEFGSPVTVRSKPYPTPHTVALVTWRNEWWLRDEFLGLIRLNLTAKTREITDQVAHQAEAMLEHHALSLSPSALARSARFGSRDAGRVDASREVARAAKLLPVTSELFCIESRGREFPLLFFRPGPDCIAVYDPRFGTATARTTVTNSAKVVELVAERLGYRVTSVRTDTRRLVAAATP